MANKRTAFGIEYTSQALRQMGVLASCEQPLSEENCFTSHMLCNKWLN